MNSAASAIQRGPISGQPEHETADLDALWANSADCGVLSKVNCPHSPLGSAFRAFSAGP